MGLWQHLEFFYTSASECTQTSPLNTQPYRRRRVGTNQCAYCGCYVPIGAWHSGSLTLLRSDHSGCHCTKMHTETSRTLFDSVTTGIHETNPLHKQWRHGKATFTTLSEV